MLEVRNRIFAIICLVKFFAIIFAVVSLFACGGKDSLISQTGEKKLPEQPIVVPAIDYKKQIAAVEGERNSVFEKYQNNSQNSEIVEKARQKFVDSVYQKIIPYWYETEWDFYGMTETPKEGKIACGYFVTTVLRDAGLRVERAKLAQQASEKIILSLTTENYVKRFRNKKLEEFVEAVENWGEGLYIVGLDFHVGFIVRDGGKTYFIHSSYIEPRKVVREIALESNVLASSKYRIIGKISDDDELLSKWLLQKNIPTK